MTRNIKVVGLALVAALAMSAMATSGAQAANGFKLTVDTYPAHIEALQIGQHLFTVHGGRTVTCATATFTSDPIPEGGESTVTFTPAYSGCHSKLGATLVPATVKMNGCDYVLRATAHPETHKFTGNGDLVCTTPNDVEIFVYDEALPDVHDSAKHEAANLLCKYTVQHQANLSSITYKNNTIGGLGHGLANNDDITLDIDVGGVAYTRVHGNTTNCGGMTGNATLSGEALALGATFPFGTRVGIRIATD